MRVLLAHRAFPPEAEGGSEVYVSALARALARRGDAVGVLFRTRRDGQEHAVVSGGEDGVVTFALVNRHERVPGFEAYRDPQAAQACAGVLDAWRPDVLHVHHLDGLSTGLVFAARDRGIPTVVTLHDFAPACALGQMLDRDLRVCAGPSARGCLRCVGAQAAAPDVRARPRGPWALAAAGIAGGLLAHAGVGARRVEARLDEMRAALCAADVLTAPSRSLAARLASFGFPSAEHVRNGHEPLGPVPRTADPAGRVRFAFIGSAIPSKGVHVLGEAFRRLPAGRAALALHGPFPAYHGDTGYERRVRGILGPLAGEAIRGPFAHADLARVLAGTDVLVVPSLWEENAPLTVEEAFQAGVPVVASGHGGLRERIADGAGGVTFAPGDAGDLARVLRRFLDEPGLQERLAAAAPPVETMDRHLVALDDVYGRAAARARGRAGRVGVVVLDHGRPRDAARAVASAADPVHAPLRLVVENGPQPESAAGGDVELLRLPGNGGYAAGMNAGVRELLERGCDRVLLLNSDAVLAPGALWRLADALSDPRVAAVCPRVRREADGRVESEGATFADRIGRPRLLGHGAAFEAREGQREADSLSGAAWMIRADAWRAVGPLDEGFFFGFEETDWCLRARRRGYGVAVVLGAVATHAGSATAGADSPERLFYAARNHRRTAARHRPAAGTAALLRDGWILGLNLAHAVRQRRVPRAAALRAVLRGVRA